MRDFVLPSLSNTFDLNMLFFSSTNDKWPPTFGKRPPTSGRSSKRRDDSSSDDNELSPDVDVKAIEFCR